MSSTMQIVFQLMVLSVIMTMAVSRPQNAIENMWNQESAENQPSISDLINLQKFYTSYRMAAGPNGYMGVEESRPSSKKHSTSGNETPSEISSMLFQSNFVL